MDNKLDVAFTEEEFMALARQKYYEIKDLKSIPTFYDYEKAFEQIIINFAQQVLQKSLSDVPDDRRKKKACPPALGR